jgi:flagellar hook protein FlgE
LISWSIERDTKSRGARSFSLSIYQEQYQASARIIDVASTVFDTLLGLRG